MSERTPEDEEVLSAKELVEYHTRRLQEEGPEYLDGLLSQDADRAATDPAELVELLARLFGVPLQSEPYAALRALADYRRHFGTEERASRLALEAGKRLLALRKRLSAEGPRSDADIENYLNLRSLFEVAEAEYQKRRGYRKGGEASPRARGIMQLVRQAHDVQPGQTVPTAEDLWNRLRAKHTEIHVVLESGEEFEVFPRDPDLLVEVNLQTSGEKAIGLSAFRGYVTAVRREVSE